jgi:hypothetical protein
MSINQYSIEIHGEFADIFKKIREILLSYRQIKEIKMLNRLPIVMSMV